MTSKVRQYNMDILLNSRQKTKNSLHEETIIGNPIQFYSGLKGFSSLKKLAFEISPINNLIKDKYPESEPVMVGTGRNLCPWDRPDWKIGGGRCLLSLGTYTFLAQGQNFNSAIFNLELQDSSLQRIYPNNSFTIQQNAIYLYWEINSLAQAASNIYNMQIVKGVIEKSLDYTPYEYRRSFANTIIPLSGTFIITNNYLHEYSDTFKQNKGYWDKNDSSINHYCYPFDWYDDIDTTLWQGIFNPNTGRLISNMERVTCRESLYPLINERTETGGYVNTENGLYFETGGSTEELQKYIGKGTNDNWLKAKSDVLANYYNITAGSRSSGYFKDKLSTDFYDSQDNTYINGIQIYLPEYCGSTLEEKRAYLQSNPINILYPLKYSRIYQLSPIQISEEVIQKGVNRFDIQSNYFQDWNDRVENYGGSTHQNIILKTTFMAPQISYCKQYPGPHIKQL